jgi:preprotein translocase subunit YajC
MELEVDVEGVEKTLNEIERDLHRGMEKSMDNLVDNAKGRARRVIAETDSIFNAEVYKGFKDAETKNSSTRIRTKVYNDVGHADALEHGAEYGSKGPPVAALLPWVARKMHWSPDFDIDFDSEDPDGGGGRPVKGNYSSGTFHTANGSTTSQEVKRGDIVKIYWEDGSVDSDVPVIDITDNNIIKGRFDGGSHFVNLDGRDSYKRANEVVKTGEVETIEVEEGDVIVSDLNIKGTVKKVEDDEITIEFEDDVSKYTDTVDATTVANEYKYYSGPKVVDEDTLEEDLTDEGLTLAKQSDDLSLVSGNLGGMFERGTRETLFRVEAYQRDLSMPKVDKLGYGNYETVEDAFNDDSRTITIPNNLLEFDTKLTGANFDDLSIDNGNYYNATYETHLDYVIDHQYGQYVYDNLTTTGLDEFRKRWGFIEEDGVWKLPEDAGDLSGLAETGERAFFAEVFVRSRRRGYGYKTPRKEDYFERIESLDSDFFKKEFRDKSTDTVGYNIGYDYSGDREVVLEEHIDDYSTRDTDSFTTDFNNLHYLGKEPQNRGYKEYSEYIFTSPRFEGAKVIKYIDGEFRKNGLEYSEDELTLQGIPTREQRFNSIQQGDEIIVDTGGFSDTEGLHSVRFDYVSSYPWLDELAEAKDVFSDEPIQVNPDNIIGSRSENPDLWTQGHEIVQPVDSNDVDESLTSEITDENVTSGSITRTLNEVGHIVLKDSSGNNYRAERSDKYDYDYVSLYPNEDGDHLEWTEDDVDITYLSEHNIKYQSIEDGDYIIVDPDSMDSDSAHSDSKYRATVKFVSSMSGKPSVIPFGTSSKTYDDVNYDSFVETRDEFPGWEAKNFDTGTKVTVDTYTGEKTGRLDTKFNSNSKSYELNRMSMISEDDKRDIRFYPDDIISYEEDDFMEQGSPAPDMDFSITEYEKYNGELTEDDFRASSFSPLDGYDNLEEGTDIRYKRGGSRYSGTITSVFTNDGQREYVVEDEDGGNVKITPDKVERFEGMGVDREDISVGDTISDGSSFGEIVGIRDGDTSTGVEVDYSGDGEYEELLDLTEIQEVNFILPEDTGVFFWSVREEEWKTGKVTSNSYGMITVETKDGEEYTSYSNAYPIEISGIDM